MDSGSDHNGQSQMQNTSDQAPTGADSITPSIPESQKPVFSKDDLEQILAETLRIAIDIVKAKKQYVPQSSSSSQQYQYQKPAYNGGGNNYSQWGQRPPGQVAFGQGQFQRAPSTYYRN